MTTTMTLEITMNAQKNLLAVEVHPIHTLNQRQTGANVGNANQWLRRQKINVVETGIALHLEGVLKSYVQMQKSLNCVLKIELIYEMIAKIIALHLFVKLLIGNSSQTGMGIQAKEIEKLPHLVWFSGLEGSIPQQLAYTWDSGQNNVQCKCLKRTVPPYFL